MKYYIWSEGYAINCDRGTAQYHGDIEAISFQEACDKLFSDNDTYNSKTLSLWECGLFDNKVDAEREFE